MTKKSKGKDRKMIHKYAIMPDSPPVTTAVAHHHDCVCTDCCAKRRSAIVTKIKSGHAINCGCFTCNPQKTSHDPAPSYGHDWRSWFGMGGYRSASPATPTTYTPTVKCEHFRQEVAFGDKYKVLCSSWRDIPKKAEDLEKAAQPDLGVYLDYSLWSDEVDPIKVSPGLKDYPDSDKFYDTILIKWPDRGVPDKALLTELVDYLQEKVEAGTLIDIGCHGGHGRTGTLLGCLIARLTDMEPEAVIKYVREKYCKEAIESKSQEAAIYEIVGKTAPVPPPVKPSTQGYLYPPYGTGMPSEFHNKSLSEILLMSKEEKVKLLRPDKTHGIHECVECHNKVEMGAVIYHDAHWNYKVCKGCYEAMGGSDAAWYKAEPISSKEDKWDYTYKSVMGSALPCDDCKIAFKMGEKMWYFGKDWNPLLCDPCYQLRTATSTNSTKGPDGVEHFHPPEDSVTKVTIDSSDEEKDQFAYILGFNDYKELSDDIQETVKKS